MDAVFLKIAPTGLSEGYVNAAGITRLEVWGAAAATYYIRAWTDHTGSGQRYTLDGGPYASEAEANTALNRLAAAIGGVDASVFA